MAQFNIKPGAEFAHSNTVSVRVAHVADLDETIKKIRFWLELHKIQPARFRTTGDARGYCLSLDFNTAETAQRFRENFVASHAPRLLLSDQSSTPED
jgi:hypothetical protein